MPKNFNKQIVKSPLTQGILSTLAFFGIYKLPISANRLWELLYKAQATKEDLQLELDRLVQLNVIVFKNGMYALEPWDEKRLKDNQVEIDKRWTRVKKYYWLLSALPFVEHVSVINSVAMGNADSESDIDFFVITKPNRIYFVRSMIIVLFKLLGVYKSRDKVNLQFCFGFYISSNRLSIKDLLLPGGDDPYLVFWLATITPIYSLKFYEKFMKENRWVYSYFPNFKPMQRLEMYRKLTPSTGLNRLLTAVCWLPAILLESLLRRIHIRHTFNLPENNWKTSSTIANKYMLKLHALDPRKDLRRQFYQILQKYN